MASLNNVVMAGNLTRDPKKISGPEKKTCVVLRIAVNETYNGENACTTYTDLKVFGKAADCANDQLHTGSGILIEGKLRNQEWTSNAGEKHYNMIVHIDRWQHLDKKKEGSPEQNETSNSNFDAIDID